VGRFLGDELEIEFLVFVFKALPDELALFGRIEMILKNAEDGAGCKTDRKRRQTAGVKVVGELVQRRAKPPPATLEPVESGAPAAETKFGPIRMYSALARSEVPVRDREWFAWALAVPPLAFLGLIMFVGASRRRERRATTSAAVQRKILRSARDALDSDDPRSFYDRIVAAITHALDSRLGEPVGGLSQTELRTKLDAAGFDRDLVERIVNELEGADFARFAASGARADEMNRCLQRTVAIVERIQFRKKEPA